MRALSLQQPWADAVLHLGKRIENRRPESSAHKTLLRYREPFLLHASKGVGSIRDFSDACEAIREVADEEAWMLFRDEYLGIGMHRHSAVFLPRTTMLRGGIVGVARCVGLYTPNGAPYLAEGIEADRRYRPNMRWKAPGQFGHILANVEPVPFVPCAGALGLWEVPDAVMRQVQLSGAGMYGQDQA
jgi:hypothetical protein